jgi:hypothetical protein
MIRDNKCSKLVTLKTIKVIQVNKNKLKEKKRRKNENKNRL